MKAPTFSISRCSLHDGNGIRTVVYCKGCPMHCLWCHNPESHNTRPEILFYPDRCIGCGRCLSCCPQSAHTAANDNTHIMNRSLCTACGICADNCPSGALMLCGKNMDVESVMDAIMRDKPYFERSNGGVTFSGGECLLYPEFLKEVILKCKANKINTAIETALHISWENIAPLITLTDTFYCDVKHSESETHRKLTGVGNELILENLFRLSSIHQNIIVRIPLIPQLNDDDENLKKTAVLISKCSGVQGIELLKYNHLSSGKNAALGKEFQAFGQPQSDEEIERKKSVIAQVLPKNKFVL